ncbi:uncharacterized protein LOC142591270 [Dermacentor variabilis]|uniref:uncharacterized protein LOC142591270 n=1 Tax=Dermacentor variabilis TaxID=34621 RepID=UPI003F5C4ECA
MSLVEPLITDPVVLSIMSEVRKAKGVHVYLDVSLNDKSTKQLSFTKDDLRHVTRRLDYHLNSFNGIQVLEHHLEYTGITEALPREANKPYISLKFADVCYLSAGGYAVIEGKYQKIDSTLSGILIGVDKSDNPEFQTFPSYNNPQELVTIVVSIGEKYCAISSGSSHVQLSRVQPGDDFVWLVVNNIDIEKLEIHRGMKPR